MSKLVIAVGAILAFGSQLASAATSVSTWTGGSLSYDATTATMTGTHTLGYASLSNLEPNRVVTTTVPTIATLRIGFAAPLVRSIEFHQAEWTGGGHRYVASVVRGTAIDFEYVVNSLPDSDGITENLLTIRSQPGFSVPFFHLKQIAYYYDFEGNIRIGIKQLYNEYDYFGDLSFVGLFAPCNCIKSGGNYGPSITAFTATSEIDDYVQNIFRPSNALTVNTGVGDPDLWGITAASQSTLSSFDYGSASGVTWSPPVPEPASWAMMIAGFGLTGTAMRRRVQRILA